MKGQGREGRTDYVLLWACAAALWLGYFYWWVGR